MVDKFRNYVPQLEELFKEVLGYVPVRAIYQSILNKDIWQRTTDISLKELNEYYTAKEKVVIIRQHHLLAQDNFSIPILLSNLMYDGHWKEDKLRIIFWAIKNHKPKELHARKFIATLPVKIMTGARALELFFNSYGIICSKGVERQVLINNFDKDEEFKAWNTWLNVKEENQSEATGETSK